MAKSIYCLKMFIFRKQFSMSKFEVNACRSVSIFIVKVYIRAWFCAPSSYKAPYQDLNFFKQLFNYIIIDANISRCTLRKFLGHLWYLAPETAALAFFDSSIPVELKIKMVESLKKENKFVGNDKRFIIQECDIKNYYNFEINDFINKDSLKFFERFKLNINFLDKPPNTWSKNESYL